MSNIKSVKTIGKARTYDIEVAHTDHQFYLANGVLTSNSYLTELSECSNKAEMIGKHNIFVKTKDNRLWLLQDDKENQFTEAVHGPTISAWTKETIIDFPNTGLWGEDLAFISEMRAKGAQCWSSSKWNFMFQRHKNHNHTWLADDHQISQCWHYSHSKNKNSKITEYNVSVKDAQKIVSKQLSVPFGIEIQMQEFKKEDSPSYKITRDHIGSMEDWIVGELRNLGLD